MDSGALSRLSVKNVDLSTPWRAIRADIIRGQMARRNPVVDFFGGISVCAGEEDGAEPRQNRQIPDRKAYSVRRGRVLAIENGK